MWNIWKRFCTYEETAFSALDSQQRVTRQLTWGHLCAAVFCPPPPTSPCSRCWLAIISGGRALCYRSGAEPRHNNAQTEASHALRQRDSSEHQWLACIQSAQLLLDWQLCFLVFAGSGGALSGTLCSTSAPRLVFLKLMHSDATQMLVVCLVDRLLYVHIDVYIDVD